MRQLLALFFLVVSYNSAAHEVRPGYLEIRSAESSNDTPSMLYDVLWKMPVKGPARLQLSVSLPDDCSERTPISSHVIDAARIDRWQISCTDGLADKPIRIDGLQNTITDVLLRIQHTGGSTETVRLTPKHTDYVIQGEQAMHQVFLTYMVLGIEHILLGIDHLLFVFALLLIVNSTRKLIITITAFTIAHSITLAAASLDIINIPQQPVEAVIALSILFLAVEVIHGRQGRPGYAARWPWLVAFSFGLLHGFGFAGALAEIGLPQHSIPLALISFNIGVELGQLSFILMVASISWLLHMADSRISLRYANTVTVYSIGGLSSFWLIERISTF